MAEENKLGREIMRLAKLSRDVAADCLLDEALAGRERTVDSVTKLFSFIVKHFGQDGSSTTDKFWTVCSEFLAEAGVQGKDLQRIRRPYPVFGSKDFKSVLEEFEA